MITSKNLTLIVNVIPSESKFESNFHHGDEIKTMTNCTPTVAFLRYGYIPG